MLTFRFLCLLHRSASRPRLAAATKVCRTGRRPTWHILPIARAAGRDVPCSDFLHWSSRLDFNNGLDDDWRSNRQALHSIDQPHMACIPAKNLDKHVRSSVRHKSMLSKLFSRRHQYRQLDELFEPVNISEMFLCDGERIERGDARCFLPV